MDDRSAPTFEMPTSRNEEFAGGPGLVRFLDLPARRFVMIDGDGRAGEPAFAPRMPGLYATAYGLRFALKRRGVEERVAPLEGLWWTVDGATDLDLIFGGGDRSGWRWTLMIRLPDQATEAELANGVEAARTKLAEPHAANLRIETFAEGRAAQILHLGPYAAERSSIERLHEAIAAAGLAPARRHHEIYLGDPRRAAPDRLRTILRQPVAAGRSSSGVGVDRVERDPAGVDPADDPRLATLLIDRIDEPVVGRMTGVHAGQSVEVVTGAILDQLGIAPDLHESRRVVGVDGEE
jgi:hypothetical protein